MCKLLHFLFFQCSILFFVISGIFWLILIMSCFDSFVFLKFLNHFVVENTLSFAFENITVNFFYFFVPFLFLIHFLFHFIFLVSDTINACFCCMCSSSSKLAFPSFPFLFSFLFHFQNAHENFHNIHPSGVVCVLLFHLLSFERRIVFLVLLLSSQTLSGCCIQLSNVRFKNIILSRMFCGLFFKKSFLVQQLQKACFFQTTFFKTKTSHFSKHVLCCLETNTTLFCFFNNAFGKCFFNQKTKNSLFVCSGIKHVFWNIQKQCFVSVNHELTRTQQKKRSEKNNKVQNGTP